MADTATTFQELGLSEAMQKALEKKGYGYPTSIQREAIPPLLAWKDVIAKAPTGTGKTFAFGIPMIEHVIPEQGQVQGLILVPTREPGCGALRRRFPRLPSQSFGKKAANRCRNAGPAHGSLQPEKHSL